MDDGEQLNVVLCWHMHQPEYRDYRSGQYQLPWTYLHTIKDYVDMAALLEQCPQAQVVVNFAPILLQQIDNYSQQVSRFFSHCEAISDPLLNALVEPTLPVSTQYRYGLIKACMRVNETHLVKRFAPFKGLYHLGQRLMDSPEDLRYLSDQYFADLLMWYHLAWLGETVRASNTQVTQLMEKEQGYTLHDRRELLAVIGELLSHVIERYRRLSERGQVELSLSPFAHPIIPLLINTQSAKEAMPEVNMPLMEHYPHGNERARWHLTRGIEVFEHYFLTKPKGCWLSEGAISDDAVVLLDQQQFSWTASGEAVLRNSLTQKNNTETQLKERFLYQPYQLNENRVNCFFRDDELSDLIGFTYSDWHGDDAAANLVSRLEAIANNPETPNGAVVSLILDGENAWEYYPYNGYYFLRAAYQGIASSNKLKFSTFSQCVSTQADKHQRSDVLTGLVAGSWVYGTFSTWIGDTQKNRGWDMLGDAKRCYDSVIASGRLNKEQCALAQQQLAICESSDWFWWFGDYNPADTVSDFERLFRMHLANLYQYLGEEPPEYISQVFTHGSGRPLHGGVMRASGDAN